MDLELITTATFCTDVPVTPYHAIKRLTDGQGKP